MQQPNATNDGASGVGLDTNDAATDDDIAATDTNDAATDDDIAATDTRWQLVLARVLEEQPGSSC